MPGIADDVRLKPSQEMLSWIASQFTWLKTRTRASVMAANTSQDLCAWCTWRLTGRAPDGDQGADIGQETFDFGENDALG